MLELLGISDARTNTTTKVTDCMAWTKSTIFIKDNKVADYIHYNEQRTATTARLRACNTLANTKGLHTVVSSERVLNTMFPTNIREYLKLTPLLIRDEVLDKQQFIDERCEKKRHNRDARMNKIGYWIKHPFSIEINCARRL